MSPLTQGTRLRLTVAQAIVKYLQVQYSEQDAQLKRLIRGVFGIFGHGNVSGLGQALYEYGSDLPYYQPRNEQSMVHTAVGYAKATRRLSTFACTASVGPGSMNMLTAAAGASINRLPVLLLPSDYYVTRHQGPVLQQLEHPISADVSLNDCFRTVSRFFDRISRPEQLLTALPEAMRVLTDPAECGPVTLSLPQDLQTEAYDYPSRFFEERVWRVERRLPDPQRIAEAAALLKLAKRPVLIAGGGVIYSNATEALEEFSMRFGVPVGETTAGKGSVKHSSPIFLGSQGVQGSPVAAKVMAQADLVLCIGTRLSDFSTGSHSLFQHPEVKFINVNVCSRDAFKMGGLPVIADAQKALRALANAADQAGVRPDLQYLEEVTRARQEWDKVLSETVLKTFPGETMNEGHLTSIVFEESQPGDVAVGASSGLLANVFKLWDTTQARSCYLEFGFSCMGFELPAGLGARMAHPTGEVFVFMGDGTYLMNPMELVTAMQEGLKVTVILSENHGYQCIIAHQMHRAGHSFGNEFRARDSKTNRLEGEYVRIDYAKNAESLGARSWHARNPGELRQALRDARQEPRACVVVVETEPRRNTPGSEIWWDVSVAEVSGDPLTKVLRADYERERSDLRRFYY